jgi:hypothetical protein
VLAYFSYLATGTLAGTVHVALFLFYGFQVLALASLVSLVCPKAPAKGLLFAVLVWFVIPASLVAGHVDLTDRIVKYQFSIGTHFSALIVASLAVAVAIRVSAIPNAVLGRSLVPFVLLSLLSLLGGVSNKLFFVYGAIPVVVLAGYTAIRDRRYSGPLLIVSASLLGISLALFFDSLLNRQGDIGLAKDIYAILKNARSLTTDVLNQLSTGSVALRIWVLGSLAYLFAVPAYLLRALPGRQKEVQRDAEYQFELLVMSFWSASAMSVAGAILTYAETPTWRYLPAFFYYPLLHLALYAARRMTELGNISVRARRLTMAIAIGVFGFQGMSLARQASVSTNDLHRESSERARRLADCIRENHLHAGVASYWLARHLTFFSRDSISLLPVPPWDVSGGFFYWGNNAFDFFQSNNGPIVYDFLLVDGFVKQDVIRAYGYPSREIGCGMGMLLFAYDNSEAFFGNLVERHPQIFFAELRRSGKVTIPAAALMSEVGSRVGRYRQASAPGDRPGFIVFGPYMPLGKGSYKVVVRYEVRRSSEPDHGEMPNYVDVTARRGRTRLADMPMATHTGEHTLTVPFRLERSYGDIETRVWFSGRGRLLVREMTLIRVER